MWIWFDFYCTHSFFIITLVWLLFISFSDLLSPLLNLLCNTIFTVSQLLSVQTSKATHCLQPLLEVYFYTEVTDVTLVASACLWTTPSPDEVSSFMRKRRSLLEKLTVWKMSKLLITRRHIEYISAGPTSSSSFAHQYNLIFSNECIAGWDVIEVSVHWSY